MGGFIKDNSADSSVGQGAINAEVLEGAGGDVQQLSDFIGFEPLFLLLGFDC